MHKFKFLHSELYFLEGDEKQKRMIAEQEVKLMLASAIHENKPDVLIPPTSLFRVYEIIGAQMRVSEDVCRDIAATDFPSIDIDEIVWPYPCLELIFENKVMPSLLLTKVNDDVVKIIISDHMTYIGYDEKKWFEIMRKIWGANEYILALFSTINEGQRADGILRVHFNMVGSVLDGSWKEKTGDISLLPGYEIGCMTRPPMSAMEEMASMFKQALKILVFASIPKYKPVEFTGTPSKAEGGKPGFQNRPKRPALRVMYLPSVINEIKEYRETVERESIKEAAKKKHEFKGRRGHIHRYKSDRFVNRKGTWDYFPPIYATKKERTLYVIR